MRQLSLLTIQGHDWTKIGMLNSAMTRSKKKKGNHYLQIVQQLTWFGQWSIGWNGNNNVVIAQILVTTLHDRIMAVCDKVIGRFVGPTVRVTDILVFLILHEGVHAAVRISWSSGTFVERLHDVAHFDVWRFTDLCTGTDAFRLVTSTSYLPCKEKEEIFIKHALPKSVVLNIINKTLLACHSKKLKLLETFKRFNVLIDFLKRF